MGVEKKRHWSKEDKHSKKNEIFKKATKVRVKKRKQGLSTGEQNSRLRKRIVKKERKELLTGLITIKKGWENFYRFSNQKLTLVRTVSMECVESLLCRLQWSPWSVQINVNLWQKVGMTGDEEEKQTSPEDSTVLEDGIKNRGLIRFDYILRLKIQS